MRGSPIDAIRACRNTKTNTANGSRFSARSAAGFNLSISQLPTIPALRSTTSPLANVLKLIGAENSAAFELFAVNSTPVDGKANRSTRDRVSENRYVIVANSAAATKIVLSLVTARVRPGCKLPGRFRRR